MKTETLKISGMLCASCALSIQKSLSKIEGMKKSQVNFATTSAYLKYDEEKVDKRKIEDIINKLGYKIIKKSLRSESLEKKG